MYCPFCGYELPDEAIFCQRCGKRLPDYNKSYSQNLNVDNTDASSLLSINITENPKEKLVSIDAIPTSSTQQEKIQTENIVPSQTGVSKEVEPTSNTDDEDKTNILGIVSFIGLVIFVIICAFIFLGGGGDDDSTNRYEKISVPVTSNPSGAEVYIAGEYLGLTPLNLDLMPNTGYMIVIKKDGYKQWAQSVNPGDGAYPISVHASLTPASSYTPTYVPTYTPTSGTIDKEFVWDYNGYTFTHKCSISKQTYLYYKNNQGHSNGNLVKYATDSVNQEFISDLANSMMEAGDDVGFNEFEKVMMVVTFVQSLPYTSDSVTTGHDEYVRYPLETLVDGGGDCEDTAILTASILKEMNYGVVLLRLPGHVAVGVKGGEGIYGTYWTYQGDRFFYLETTGKNWEIGEIPNQYKSEKATIIPIN